jgi:hypothetical protein
MEIDPQPSIRSEVLLERKTKRGENKKWIPDQATVQSVNEYMLSVL